MKVHLVSFDVPFPADYGGVIDVFYKLKALKLAGCEVVLHCYEYGRGEQPALKDVAAAVRYYKRRTGLITWMSDLPYIVAGRNSPELFEQLTADEAPVILEGIHCTAPLPELKRRGKKVFVRCHNVESAYYGALAGSEPRSWKRIHFKREADKLKNYETCLEQADGLFSISKADHQWYSKRFSRVHYVPAFHPSEAVRITPGTGTFALYHGNLSVRENEEAAIFLVEQVFRGSGMKLKIAGDRPSTVLMKVIASVPEAEWCPWNERLISEAQVHVLPTFQSTGIKLKLLKALHQGRHCVVNTPMIRETGLGSLCHVADSPDQWRRILADLWKIPVPEEELKKRQELLGNEFSNENNVKKLIGLLTAP